MDLPLSYWLLKLGYPPYSVMYVALFTTTVGLFARLFLMKRLITYSARYFLMNVFLKNVLLIGVSVIVLSYLQSLLPVNFLMMLLMVCLCVLLVGSVVFFGGMECNERKMVIQILANKTKGILRDKDMNQSINNKES